VELLDDEPVAGGVVLARALLERDSEG
jgi:hypothetical protein